MTTTPISASPVQQYLESLLDRFAAVREGEVAEYIPELAAADPELFGICIVTLDGAIYEVGDTREPFTIQSMSKPLTYGYVLERLGEERVHRRVGVEPSGDPFNEISLDPSTGAPINPMINAGAIACAALAAARGNDPLADLLAAYGRYAGRGLFLDEAVYLSERETGHRNRAIAHLLSSFGLLDVPAEDAVDLYFRQCSVSVDCRDLALIGATLANGGVNPVSDERALGPSIVRGVLSVMTTCGMYDGAGSWLRSVGLPAKSGVSGGVFAVLPGRLGIGVFSPALDERGNSVRGVAVCRALSDELALHLVRPGERGASPVRARHDLGVVSSRRIRPAAEREAIGAFAASTAVIELQGELDFMSAEAVSRLLIDADPQPRVAVVDLRRIAHADQGGSAVLSALIETFNAGTGALALAGVPEPLEFDPPAGVPMFARLDEALEWAEDEVLSRTLHPQRPSEVDLADHELLADLSVEELHRLTPSLGSLSVAAETEIVREGDVAEEIYLVVRGTLSVLKRAEHRAPLRLGTFSAGMTFGELGYLERGLRTADVRADTDVECRTLPYSLLDSLATSEPTLCAKLLRGIARSVASSLRLANLELDHLNT
jgi:glutaminase